MVVGSDECFQRGAFPANRRAVRTNGVVSDCRRDDEGLGIVNNEWSKCAVRAFDNRFVTLTEIDDETVVIEGPADLVVKPTDRRH